MSQRPEPSYLAVGRVVRPHGVRGELRVEILTDYPERLPELEHVYVGPRRKPHKVRQVRLHGDVMLLTLEGITDRNAAEALRGALIEIPVTDAAPVKEDEYYHYQLVGVRVETEAGESLGGIVEVLSLPQANDVFVVQGPRGEILIPAIREVVVDLDLEAERMIIRPLPGLFEEEAL